jgi:hypothetical protein
MFTRPIVLSMIAAAAAVLVAPGSADADVTAYADAVKAKTNDYYRAWTISKLTTWKVGKKCWEKIVAPEGRILDLTSFMTREIAGYAKQVTGDDWATIEGSGMSEKEANKAKLEPMVTAFRQKFSLSVSIDGDDCDASHDPLWMQYVMRAVEAVNAKPPAAGKAFIVIDVSSKTKQFSIAASKDGATFKISGPKEIASAKWQDELGRVFAQAAKKK